MVPLNGVMVNSIITVNRMPQSRERIARIISGFNPFPSLDTVKQRTNYTEFATGLEQIHNLLHDWVGGTMANLATAAADPLFWMHHANIDRIWWQWQQSLQGKGKNPQLTGVDAIMDPWRYDEPQTRDIATFNYVYA
jgi:tyrosinase